MKCPKCNSTIFGNSWHKANGAVCRGCGALGTFVICGNGWEMTFLPDKEIVYKKDIVYKIEEWRDHYGDPL